MEQSYLGEHLFPGQLGHFLTILSMVAALLATVAYFVATQLRDTDAYQSWRRIGRVGFGVHGLAIFGIVATLFYMIWTHLFEYHYVFSHSSTDLPVKYMISCFWEGQEGSFLLWSFWHAILGFLTIMTARKWETPVMAVLSFTQIFLAAMLIGIYFFGYKVGSSPFILMRDLMPANPAFLNPNYLAAIQDGNGLNPLLQNYWMVIHPPVLFLGFAATIMPFAYSLAAMWKGEYGKDWVLPTLRWSLFAGCILGVGILMGGAWAYESLSFGGYWAWDPVENASLVPWLIGICGIHTLLAYKHTGHALKATFVFNILTFILILYSTFLTRSGILGDTSVHAFVDLGMSGQLLVFLFSFLILSFVFLFYKWRSIPTPEKEEPTYSKEFWLFIGSLVIFLVALLIGIDTSWPVINKIAGTDRVIVEPIAHYNRYTIWFGIVALLIAATTQFLRYRSDNWKSLQKLSSTLLTTIFLSGLIAYFGDFGVFEQTNFFNLFEIPFLSPYFLLLFASIYAIVGNAAYIFQVLRGKIKVAGSAVAHIGFGLMLLGVLISASKKQVISFNNAGLDYGEGFSAQDKVENVFLPRGQAIQMGDYWVTYADNHTERFDTYYQINYERKKNEKDRPKESFTLQPYAQINPKMGLVSNPSTKHYWDRDIFTFVSSIPNNDDPAQQEQTYKDFEMAIGDTVATSQALIILKSLNPAPLHTEYIPVPNDIAVGAVLELRTLGQSYDLEPIYYIRQSVENRIPAQVDGLGITVNFEKVLPQKSKVKLSVVETSQGLDYVIMKAMVFPFINVLWLGCVVMALGFAMSIVQRYREGKRLKN